MMSEHTSNTEQDNDLTDSDKPDNTTIEAEVTAESDNDLHLSSTSTTQSAPQQAIVKTSWSGRLALLLVLALMGVLGWFGWQNQWWDQTQEDAQQPLIDQQQADISQLQQSLRSLQSELTTLQSAPAQMGAQDVTNLVEPLIEHAQDQLGNSLQDQLQQQLQSVQNELNSLQSTPEPLTAQEVINLVGPLIENAKNQVSGTTQALMQQQFDQRDAQLEQTLDTQQSLLGRLESQMVDVGQQQQQQQTNRNVQNQAQLLHDVKLLLRYAQQQLLLNANTSAAINAYEEAENIISGSNQPGTNNLRNALTNERQAIQAVEIPDIDLIVTELRGLEQAVTQWPIVGQVVPTESTVDTANQPEAATWRDKLSNSFGQLVQVRKTDETILSLEQVDFLRQQLSLHLQTTTLLVLQGREDAFKNILGDAQQLLEQHFDTSNRGVSSAISTMQSLSESNTTPDWPELGAASQQLQVLTQANGNSANQGNN